MKLSLILLIALSQGFILFIPQDKTIDNRSNFPKKITKHGRKLIFFIVVTIVCTVILFFISEKEAQDFDRNIRHRDSITDLNRKVDAKSYEKKIIDANAENRKVLLEYGLEMDVKNERLQKTVEKSRDTSFRGVAPHLELFKMVLIDSTSKDKYVVKYTFSSTGATSYNIKVKMDVILMSTESKFSYWIKQFIPITKGDDIEKGQGYTTLLNLPKNNFFIEMYYFHIYGTYEKQDNKVITINRFYVFNLKENEYRFGSPNQLRKIELDKFIELNH